MKLNRDTVEKMMVGAQMQPAHKEKVGDYEVFVGDGYSFTPEATYKRFGAEPGDFNGGAFCTVWFVARDETFFEVGSPALYRTDHNPELDTSSKRRARINRAMKDAKEFIDRRKRVAAEGVPLQ